MRNATLVHPRLLQELLAAGFFPYTATIQRSTPTRGTAGSVIEAWTTVPGLEAIPATKGVVSGTEVRGVEMTTDETRVIVQLAGYFSDIDSAMRCLLDDGSINEIVAANADELRVMSQLVCRTVTPDAYPGE